MEGLRGELSSGLYKTRANSDPAINVTLRSWASQTSLHLRREETRSEVPLRAVLRSGVGGWRCGCTRVCARVGVGGVSVLLKGLCQPLELWGGHFRSSTAGVVWELPYSMPRAWGRLGFRGGHPHVSSPLPFSFPVGPELAVPGKQKQDFSPGGLGRGGWEHGMHAGLCLQTLQENAGCSGQEGFLEIFSSSESISTSKLKAFDGWQASFCGRLPAGPGKGVGAKVTVLR